MTKEKKGPQESKRKTMKVLLGGTGAVPSWFYACILGTSDISVMIAFGMILAFTAVLFIFSLHLLKHSTGLRS